MFIFLVKYCTFKHCKGNKSVLILYGLILFIIEQRSTGHIT